MAKFTMSAIHSKIIRHAKREKNMNYNKNNQSLKTDPYLSQILEFAPKDIKYL